MSSRKLRLYIQGNGKEENKVDYSRVTKKQLIYMYEEVLHACESRQKQVEELIEMCQQANEIIKEKDQYIEKLIHLLGEFGIK